MSRSAVDSSRPAQGYPRRARPLTLLCTATLVAVALWAGGTRFSISDLRGLRGKPPAEIEEKYAVAPQLPTTPPERTQIAQVLPGAESSTSTVPRPLVLVSTSPGPTPREGVAHIGTHSENPQTYSAGALLANGARLLEIHDRFVVLERDGDRARIYQGSNENDPPTELALVGGASTKRLKPSYSEALVDYIRPSPVYDDVSMRGYQVYAGQRSGIFFQLGLQNGDVILSLDDQPLIEAHQAMDLLNQLMSGISMNAVVERNGVSKLVSLDAAVISNDRESLRQASVRLQPAPLPSPK